MFDTFHIHFSKIMLQLTSFTLKTCIIYILAGWVCWYLAQLAAVPYIGEGFGGSNPLPLKFMFGSAHA